jgi:hypothetical protein
MRPEPAFSGARRLRRSTVLCHSRQVRGTALPFPVVVRVIPTGKETSMSIGTILIIILIILLLGGFSGRFRGYGYGYGNRGVGLLGIVLIVLVVLLLMGRI